MKCSCKCHSVAKLCLNLSHPTDCNTSVSSSNSRVCSDSCPLIHWCYLTVSSSGIHFSSCLHPFLSSGLLTFPIKWPKFWSFSFSISPSDEYWKLISFRIDWLDLLAVQGTLKSLLQQHSLKASIFCCSAFYLVQISHLYMTTGKTIALLDGPLSAICFCFLIRQLGLSLLSFQGASIF